MLEPDWTRSVLRLISPQRAASSASIIALLVVLSSGSASAQSEPGAPRSGVETSTAGEDTPAIEGREIPPDDQTAKEWLEGTQKPKAGEGPPPAPGTAAQPSADPVQTSTAGPRAIETRRGIIGINVDERRGRLIVQAVKPEGPAEQAGIRRGDHIVEIEGEKMQTREDFAAVMAGRRAGEKIKIAYQGQNTRTRTVSVSLAPGRKILIGGTTRPQRNEIRRARRLRRRRSRRKWYGWQSLLIDGAAAVSLFLVPAQTDLALVSATIYTLGSPIPHFAKGHIGRGLISAGLRVGVPVLTALSTAALCGGDLVCSGGPDEEVGGALVFLLGALASVVGVPVIDATVLAWERPEPVKPKAKVGSPVTVAPSVSVTGERVDLGLTGQF